MRLPSCRREEQLSRGVIFAVLAIIGLGLVRYVIPADLRTPGSWLVEPHRREAVRVALALVPFAGIAFLWFIGIFRNRLGSQEDQFFATLFLASGLLFIASVFGSAAIMEALLESVSNGNIFGETYYFGRCIADAFFNLFAMKMAGVFIFSTCTIGMRTGVLQRWIAIVGYGCTILLVVIIADWRWITLVFPCWMLLVGAQILLAEMRSRAIESALQDAASAS